MLKVCKFVLAVLVSLLLLSIFTLFYKCVPIRVVTKNGATDFTWRPYALDSTMEEGFAI